MEMLALGFLQSGDFSQAEPRSGCPRAAYVGWEEVKRNKSRAFWGVAVHIEDLQFTSIYRARFGVYSQTV